MSAQTIFRGDELLKRRQKVDGEWIEMPYPKLGGRLRVLHELHQAISINTEIVQMSPEFVVVRATIQTDKGSYSGTGTASAQRDARLADSLAELAETRAIARSLRFCGIGTEYGSAEEVNHLADEGPQTEQSLGKDNRKMFDQDTGGGETGSRPQRCEIGLATQAQCRALYALTKRARYTEEDIERMLEPFNTSRFQDLTREAASHLITSLQTEAAA